MINIYGIKTCSSVQKAIKFCKENDIEFTFIDFRETPIGEDKVNYFASKIDINLLCNSRGKKYKELNLKELNLDAAGKIQWCIKDNILIKRPVIEYGDDKVLIGFNQALYEEELLK